MALRYSRKGQMEASTPDLVADARQRIGSGVRAVATYGPDEYEVLFCRRDVEAEYTGDGADVLFEDVLLQELSRDYVQSLFDAGELDATVHSFEDAIVCQFFGPGAGVLVTYDATADVRLREFLEAYGSTVDQYFRRGGQSVAQSKASWE